METDNCNDPLLENSAVIVSGLEFFFWKLFGLELISEIHSAFWHYSDYIRLA